MLHYNLQEIFGETGPLAKCLPGFRTRSEQIQMAVKVQEAINNRRILLVEAGTGTGKSLAYLIPAFEAASNGLKIGVITSSIILQEQIARDLPRFLEAMEAQHLKTVVLKGRSNFLCERKWSKMCNHRPQITMDFDAATSAVSTNRDEAEMTDIIINWARHTTTGDSSELAFKPPQHLWRKFACIDPEDCDGKKCPFYDSCFYYKRRLDAMDADITICNYHMLFSSFETQNEMLPPFDVLICDEGHEIADIARDFLEVSFSTHHIETLWQEFNEAFKFFGKTDPAKIGTKIIQCISQADLFTSWLQDFCKQQGKPDENIILRIPLAVNEQPLYTALCELAEMTYAYATFFEPSVMDPDYRGHESESSMAATSLVKLAKKAQRLADSLHHMVKQKFSGEYVYWIENSRNNKPSLHAKPVMVDDYLSMFIFNGARTVIVTSATLSTNGNFEFIKEQYGIHDADELIVGTPFDMHQQTLWYLPPPEQLVEPKADNREAFQQNIARHVSEILTITQGRALGLFTSYQSLRTTRQYLQQHNPNLRILSQDDAPAIVLVKEFKEDIHSTLLGTRTFFTGVDVPGEALSCLILDRLPFPIMSDPVVNVLSNKPGGFHKFTIPKMIIDLKQAIGRLIRTESDVGLVVVLDSRLATASYKGIIWQSFSYEVRGTRNLDNVREFVKSWG